MATYGPGPARRPVQAHSFHGVDSWRPDGERRLHDFSFRNGNAAPQYPREHDHYEPSHDHYEASRDRYEASHDRYEPSRDRYEQPHDSFEPSHGSTRLGLTEEHSTNQRQRALGSDQRNERVRPVRRQYTGFQRGRANRYGTAARPLLRLKQADVVEQTLGVADDPNAAKRFLQIDDLTDSEEEQMEESDSDRDECNDPLSQSADMGNAESTLEPPAKRRALGAVSNEATAASQVPKWSNPDPYTSLPPVDEIRKKKDVVKFIRKARVAMERDVMVTNQAGINDDFISFGFEDTASIKETAPGSASRGIEDQDERELAVGASDPKRFSHLENLHGQQILKAPGTEDMPLSTDIKGPPLIPQSRPLPLPDRVTFEKTLRDPDDALGSRKRTHDDVIKDPPEKMIRSRRSFLEISSGSLLDPWLPGINSNPIPWLDRSARRCENMGFRLHKEICDFYEYVRPQKYEQEIREDLLDRLQTLITKQFHRCRVYCFGSFAAGIYLPNADMDVVVISETFRTSGVKVACQNKSNMHRFGDYLRKSGVVEEDSVEVITSAKVPLIKFVDQMTGIKVDMSFENQTGLTANNTFNAWKNQFPAMPIIVTLIKQFLLMRGLNEVVNGGLGGFSVTCLVTSLMQNLPRIQSGELIPEQHLGEILIEFLDLYGNRLDTSRTGISMNPPGYFDKYSLKGRGKGSKHRRQVYQAHISDRLAIMDPNDPDNDISGGSRNVGLILDRFSRAHSELMKAMKSPTRLSLLDWMLGGDYETFRYQRSHLQELYRQKRGAVIDFRVQVPALSHNESTNMELSDGIERPLGMGVAVDQYATKYFINPLNDDAKDALRHVNKKNQKLKAKKQKKKASLPKSNLKQDPKSNASPSTSKKVKSKDSADAPTKRDKKARLRQEVAKARLRQEVAELKEDIPESMAKAAADTLVQLSGQSAEHNREQKQKIEGNAEGKVERKRRKKEKLNKFLKARTQQLFSQVSGSNATPLSVLGRGSCRLDPISID